MLPVVEVVRVEETFDHGTFGYMKINKQVFCATLEPADLLNKQNVSSIPAQQYICKRIISPKYGLCFEVTNVPGRSHVLIHPGNIDDHTEGCIIVGQYWGKLGENRSVNNSGNTYKGFMEKMRGRDEFHLTISEHY